jgi:CIC family chloride channel protein
LEHYQDIDIMQGVLVEEAMSTDLHPVSTSMSLDELSQEILHGHHHGLPVLGDKGELYGVVTIKDLEEALSRPDADQLTVKDIATTDPLVAYPEEPMWAALKRLSLNNLGRLPVVERDDPRHLLGMVRRQDVIRAYNTAILHRIDEQHSNERLKLGKLFATAYVEMEVEEGSDADGKSVRDLQLAETCLIVAVQRGRQTIIAHGDTVLKAGDHVTVITSDECDLSLNRCLSRVS